MSVLELTVNAEFGYEKRNRQRVLVTRFESGKEQRRLKWTNPLRTFRVRVTNATQTEADTFRDFWNARDGAFDIFRWRDYIENPITLETVEANYQGEATDQLDRFPIVANSQTIFDDGTPLVETTDYTINDETGLITWVINPANTSVITATYQFLYIVRFANEPFPEQQMGAGPRLSWSFGMDEVRV